MTIGVGDADLGNAAVGKGRPVKGLSDGRYVVSEEALLRKSREQFGRPLTRRGGLGSALATKNNRRWQWRASRGHEGGGWGPDPWRSNPVQRSKIESMRKHNWRRKGALSEKKSVRNCRWRVKIEEVISLKERCSDTMIN
ncbi:hypothetical protein BHE74_00050635 [Ensete ventricosum]|nr:hypothetical protein BHE74_00050635 [Ensete ventricosum]